MKQNYYEVLGVSSESSAQDIKRSYRELARRYHPDVADSAETESRFKQINEAYNVLSDPLKRADYDQAHAPHSARDGNRQEFRQQMTQALGRVLVWGGVFGLAGAFLDYFLWWLGDPAGGFGIRVIAGGAIVGTMTGLIWGGDQNFVVDSFLGDSALGRVYTFLRTVVLGLAGMYVGGKIVSFGEQAAGDGAIGWPTLGASAIGVMLGAMLGSDGEAWHKLTSGKGRFELFYTALRGLTLAALGAGISAVIIGMLVVWGVSLPQWPWVIFTGFALGAMIGSMRPPNLAAYASYTSASLRSTLFILIVLGVLLIGIGAGILGRDFFAPYF